MSEYIEALLRCPLFEGTSAGEIGTMLGCMGASTRRFEKGALIFRADEPADQVGVLLAGAARVQRDGFDGNRAVRAALGPGDLFGEVFACAGVRRLPVSVEAVKPCQVLLIPLDRIIGACESACAYHSRVVMNLLRVLAAKNLQLNEKLEITSRRTTREKLLAYLNAQARAAGSSAFTIPFDRQGLADYLGVDRSALSSEIGKLRRDGVIESEKSRFRLLDGD